MRKTLTQAGHSLMEQRLANAIRTELKNERSNHLEFFPSLKAFCHSFTQGILSLFHCEWLSTHATTMGMLAPRLCLAFFVGDGTSSKFMCTSISLALYTCFFSVSSMQA